MWRQLLPIVATCLVLLGLQAGTPTACIASDTNEQFWPEANIFVRTGFNTRIFLLSSATRDLLTGPLDAQYGVHFDIGLPPFLRELFTEYDNESSPLQYLFVRGGIRYMESIDEPVPTNEWRGILEITPRDEIFDRIYIAWRNRLELRWLTEGFSWRYRTRLWLERSFYLADDLALTPYLSTELFFDSRESVTNRTRTMAGLRVGVLHWLAPEVNLGYQYDWRGETSVTYFVSGILNFYF